MTESPSPEIRPEPSFIGRLMLVVLVGVLLLVVYRVTMVFIIGFGGIVLAVAMNNFAVPLQKWLKLPHHMAVGLTALALVVGAASFLALFGTQTATQFTALAKQLPQAWESTRAWLESWPFGQWLLTMLDGASSEAGTTLLSALPLAGGVLGGIANGLLIVVVGVYLALDAKTYVAGALQLVPPARRTRARHILDAAGADLRKWLIAMTLDMLFYGTAVGIGLWLVGAPFPFPLGVLSGIAVFVPYIGPLVAMVPGLLLALSVDPHLAGYAAIVFLICHQLEGNISLPLLQRWTVRMPPAVSMLSIVGFGLLFGVWGVLLATPMAVVTLTVVRMAYIEDMLEHRGK